MSHVKPKVNTEWFCVNDGVIFYDTCLERVLRKMCVREGDRKTAQDNY